MSSAVRLRLLVQRGGGVDRQRARADAALGADEREHLTARFRR